MPAAKAAPVPTLVHTPINPHHGQDKYHFPIKWLHLCPIAYTHGKSGSFLSPCLKRAAKHLIRDYSQHSKAWWEMLIEVWDGFMEEVHKLGVDPAMQLQSHHAQLCTGGQGSDILLCGMW